jgi:regulatory protein
MKIERIEKVKLKKNMVKLFFDSGKNLIVFADSVVKFGIKTGNNISENDYKNILSFDEANKVMTYALFLVSKRSYSSKVLQEKLIQKGYDIKYIVKVINRLKELNYINDENFSKSYATYLSQKGNGEFFIKAKLRKQGIKEELIINVLKNVKIEFPPYEQIVKILKVKFKDLDMRNRSLVKNAVTFLLRRGFSLQEIAKTFREYKSIYIEE